MGNCEKFMEKIFDHVDSLLPNDKKKEIENHLDECLQCRGIYDDAKQIRQQLHGLNPIKTSLDFDTVLRTRIRMERSLNRRGILDWPFRLPVYAVAGSLAVITAFFILGDFRTSRGINPNQPQIISQSQGNLSSADFSNVNTQLREQVRFPMDKFPVLGKGTAIDSNELQRSSNARQDSLRGDISRGPIQSVEYEF